MGLALALTIWLAAGNPSTAVPPDARGSSGRKAGQPAAAHGPRALELPGGRGGIGFDDLRRAPVLGRLLIPAGRTGRLDLLDPASQAITPIGGFRSQAPSAKGGHDFGVTSADEGEGYLFATDRTSQRLEVVDPAAGKIVGGAKLDSGPDYVRYVAPTREVWVTEPDRQRIEIFRLEGGAAGTPPAPVHSSFLIVPSGPESLEVDADHGRAYTNHWSGTTVALDLRARAEVARWTNGCQGSRGLALDAARGHLFVGCAEGKAVSLDAKSGSPLGEVRTGAGVDIIDFDPGLSHLYVPGARGATLTIAGVSAGGALTRLGSVPTAAGAHCVVADGRGNAYVCDPQRGRLLVARDAYPASGK